MTPPTRLHLGCGDDYRRGWHNVDIATSVRTDQQIDLTELPWALPADHFEQIRAAHVLEHLPNQAAVLQECRRVLADGGRLTAILPVGVNAVSDPDHEKSWAWETPRYLCGARHWDVDTGLDVQHRDVTLWSTLPGVLGHLHRLSLRSRLGHYGPGAWCFSEPHSGGEFTVVFEA
jgi:SAM-dependent methyltransferase